MVHILKVRQLNLCCLNLFFGVQSLCLSASLFGVLLRYLSFIIDQKSRRPLAERLLFWSTRGEPVASAMQVRMPPCEGRHHERSELPCRVGSRPEPVDAIKAHAKGAYKTPSRVSFSMQDKGILRTQSVVYL